MCLRFVFLLITRLAAWMRLARREDAWKIAEILMLRLNRPRTRRSAVSWGFCWCARPPPPLCGTLARLLRRGRGGGDGAVGAAG